MITGAILMLPTKTQTSSSRPKTRLNLLETCQLTPQHLLARKALFGSEYLGKPKPLSRKFLLIFIRYPAAARSHIHVTKAYIPADIAKALVKHPLLVQKAVETFYTRDAIQLRVRLYMCNPESSFYDYIFRLRTECRVFLQTHLC
jgi:SGT1 protein